MFSGERKKSQLMFQRNLSPMLLQIYKRKFNQVFFSSKCPPFLPFLILHGLYKDVIKSRFYLSVTKKGYMLENKAAGELEQLFALYFCLDPLGSIISLLRYT